MRDDQLRSRHYLASHQGGEGAELFSQGQQNLVLVVDCVL